MVIFRLLSSLGEHSSIVHVFLEHIAKLSRVSLFEFSRQVLGPAKLLVYSARGKPYLGCVSVHVCVGLSEHSRKYQSYTMHSRDLVTCDSLTRSMVDLNGINGTIARNAGYVGLCHLFVPLNFYTIRIIHVVI